MIRTLAVTAALVVASTVPGVAQTALPAAPLDAAAAPDAANARAGWLQHAAAFALRRAYHEIGVAQIYGGSPYLDAAKTHYRGALARLQRNDAGAAAEAMAAAALARASIAEHPAPAPRDLPTPPPVAMGGSAMRMRPPVGGPMGAGVPGGGDAMTHPMRGGMMPGGMMRGGMMRGGMMPPDGRGGWMGGRGMHRHHERFDATRVAEEARLAGTAEAKDLAQKALDADVARTRAAFAGNAEEAMRDGQLAGDLAQAVGALARAEHPPAFPARDMRRRPSSDGIVGGTGTPS